MTCQYAANCPAPPPPAPPLTHVPPPPPPALTHVPFTSASLPYTGGELALFVGFAVALIALGLLLRYSEHAR